MNKQDAIDLVAGIGYSYFYDSVYERSLDETIDLIMRDVRLTGDVTLQWERRREALKLALEICVDAELDNALVESYGYYPSKVEGSRVFFEKLLAAIREALNEKHSQ